MKVYKSFTDMFENETYSQKEIAKILGVSESAISNAKTGRIDIPSNWKIKLKSKLGIILDPDYKPYPKVVPSSYLEFEYSIDLGYFYDGKDWDNLESKYQEIKIRKDFSGNECLYYDFKTKAPLSKGDMVFDKYIQISVYCIIHEHGTMLVAVNQNDPDFNIADAFQFKST